MLHVGISFSLVTTMHSVSFVLTNKPIFALSKTTLSTNPWNCSTDVANRTKGDYRHERYSNVHHHKHAKVEIKVIRSTFCLMPVFHLKKLFARLFSFPLSYFATDASDTLYLSADDLGMDKPNNFPFQNSSKFFKYHLSQIGQSNSKKELFHPINFAYQNFRTWLILKSVAARQHWVKQGQERRSGTRSYGKKFGLSVIVLLSLPAQNVSSYEKIIWWQSKIFIDAKCKLGRGLIAL